MFISKHRLNRLESRMERNAQYIYGYETETYFPKIVEMQLVIEQLLDFLDLEVKRVPPKQENFKLEKKKAEKK